MTSSTQSTSMATSLSYSATSSAVTTSTSTTNPPQFEFRRILGTGREERMKTVQAFLQEFEIPSTEQELIRLGKDRDGRLVYVRDEAVGLITYKETLSNTFKTHSMSNSFEITSLLIKKNTAKALSTSICKELIEKAKEKAKDLSAASISIALNTSNPLTALIQELYFLQVATLQNQQALFGLSLREKSRTHKIEEEQASSSYKKPHLSTPMASSFSSFSSATSGSYSSYSRTQAPQRSFSTPKQGSKDNPWAYTLKAQYIHPIQSGKKTIEGRINSGGFVRLKAGDWIRFFYQQKPHDDVRCEITKLTKYKSFEEMLRQENYKACLPDVSSIDQGIQVYNNIPGYKERAAQNGVLAIHLKKA